MINEMMDADKLNIIRQEQHWETTLSSRPDMFGESQSASASEATMVLKTEGMTTILELGGGQGRDTMFFAQNGFHVHVLDYSPSGITSISQKAETQGLAHLVTAQNHDIRNPLPFENDSFDA